IACQTLSQGRPLPEHLMPAVSVLAALGAWRMTQGIYRFDESLYPAITSTPLAGDIPCDVLHRMPEWCVYVETPSLTWLNGPLHGFWAYLEYEPAAGSQELHILPHCSVEAAPVGMALNAGTIKQSLDQYLARA